MATGAMSATARRLRHLRLTSVPKAHAEKMSLPMGELPQFTGFEIVLLGTGAGMPSTQRSASSLCVQLPAKSWLFDCGEGTLRQIFRSTVRVTTTEKIFLTHVHGDHLFGLPGMLCTLNALNAGNIDPSTKQVVRRPIDVYGPPGVFDFVNMALTVSCAHLGNVSITVHELVPCDFDSTPPSGVRLHEDLKRAVIRPEHVDGSLVWRVLDDGDHTVAAGPLAHSVTSVGYVVEEKPRPGRIDVAAATRRGLPPGRLYKLLKAGESVHLPDGTVLHPDEVMGPPRRGRKAAIMGDTANSSGMYTLAQNADVLVHEATLAHGNGAIALQRGHSTSAMAGYFARHMNPTLLIQALSSSSWTKPV
ncbi:ribonuclease Z [Aphanomyces invadans]|uniref:Ribonuclease Z n=1 Tax=Aphanomyces invadans TaxID=157072 RepID=A0A024UBF3_9STRA|nr:ribonuclease Z [Aphanomyces invadans]ETW03609.1 ribonuclease Z [Aphanomyces invadans]|eukprot:XP_008867838.1 ribonuclease Z [Aphanomyces invadans]